MEFYEKAQQERKRHGMSYHELKIKCAPAEDIQEVLDGKIEPARALAERICKVLGFEWNLSEFIARRRAQRTTSPITRRKIDADERAARLLGLSYGTYCAYRDTGYLETFIEQEAARKQRENKRKVNVIESHLIGGEKGKKTGFTSVTKC